MLKTLTGNNDQLWAQLTTLFAVGGPISSILLMYGLPADQTSIWMKLIQALLVIVPLVVKIVHDRSANSDAALVKSAGQVDGTKIDVDPMAASAAVIAVAASKDPSTDNVRIARP